MHNGGSASRACNRPPPPGCAAPLRCRAHFATVLIGQIAGQGLSSSARYRGACVPLHKWPGPCPAHLGAATIMPAPAAAARRRPLLVVASCQRPSAARAPLSHLYHRQSGLRLPGRPLGASRRVLRSATLSRPPCRTLLCAPSSSLQKLFLAPPRTQSPGETRGEVEAARLRHFASRPVDISPSSACPG
jgi:hypothetical protein